MSSAAQEEADRYFAQGPRFTSHPEDRFDVERDSRSSSDSFERKRPDHTRAQVDQDDDNDDEDTLHSTTNANMATATYRLPTTLFDANTGPKGVIADAQSFNRAKKHFLRDTFASFANNAHLGFSRSSPPHNISESKKEAGLSDNSDSELGASDDDDFMKQWRENRLKELASRVSASQRRQSPSKRIWGTFDEVDANGYLDAVEKVPKDATVVVCIHDPESNASAAVEDSLAIIAQKHITTRFVKLHHEIAEMQHIVVPAILAYQAGDVFATFSDCRPDGLETTLLRNGVLN